MPIEFRCAQCGKLLRTPDETAGKQAKCPECGAVMRIPAPVPGSPLPVPGPGPANPFARPVAPPPPSHPGPENPYQSPVDYALPRPTFAAAPGAIVRTPLDFGDVFSRTWRIFADQWLMCAGAWLIAFIINSVASQVLVNGVALIGVAAHDEAVRIVLMTLGQLAANIFSLWIGIGQGLFFLKAARGQQPSLGELFRGGPYFLTVLMAGLLFFLAQLAMAACFVLPAMAISWLAMPNAEVPMRLLVGVGTGVALAIVPCTIVSLMFSQFYYLILDRNAGITESLRVSKEITSGNKLMIFAIGLVAGLAGGVLVLLTCCIGILAVAPYMALLGAVMYLAMTG